MSKTLDTILEAGLRLFAGFYQGSANDKGKREMLDTEAYRFINHIRQMDAKPFKWDAKWIEFYDLKKEEENK